MLIVAGLGQRLDDSGLVDWLTYGPCQVTGRSRFGIWLAQPTTSAVPVGPERAISAETCRNRLTRAGDENELRAVLQLGNRNQAESAGRIRTGSDR